MTEFTAKEVTVFRVDTFLTKHSTKYNFSHINYQNIQHN